MNLETGVYLIRDGRLILLGSQFTMYLDGGVRISYSGLAPMDGESLVNDIRDWDEFLVVGRRKSILAFGAGLFALQIDTGRKPRIRGEIRSSGRWYGPALDDRWDDRR